MLKDKQFFRLLSMRTEGKSQQNVADLLEISRSTVGKYDGTTIQPSLTKIPRTYLTRIDPFAEHWPEVVDKLKVSSGLQAKTLFQDLQRRFVGTFQDGQIRTLERKIKMWRLQNGPDKEVMFSQVHYPGDLGASDYTKMHKLGITLQGKPFDHMLYHFVLTYSNWETCTICYSESFESLSEGFQNAVWELGGIPAKHRADNLAAAVINMGEDKGEMTVRYEGLLDHYHIERSKIQARKPNENGDVERSNGILKEAVDQRLMLRGSRDFEDIKEYQKFLRTLLKELNAGRSTRFKEDLAALKPLPSKRLDSCTDFHPKVTVHSTINLGDAVYSVPSRLMGIKPTVKQYSDIIEVWLSNVLLVTMPRMIGKRNHIDYRHIIGSLMRKPGAFANYQYHAEMFPTSHFREAYDALLISQPKRAASEYLKILNLAATYNEKEVDLALKHLLKSGENVSLHAVTEFVTKPCKVHSADVVIEPVDLGIYDNLFFSSNL
jgi:transposase